MVHLSGGTWSAPSKVVPTPVDYAGDGTSVSCPTDQFCLVLNGDGDYATYQGADPVAPATTAPADHEPPALSRRAGRRQPVTSARSASARTVRQLRVVATRPSRRSRKAL